MPQNAMACPKCGHNEFTINQVRYADAHVIANGDEIEQVDSTTYDTHWDEDSACRCRNCNHSSKAGDFMRPNPT